MGYGEGLRKNRCGVYCWRWVVPHDLRPKFPIKDILRSLGTKDASTARIASLSLRLAVADLVMHARAGFVVSGEQLKAALELARQASKRHAERELADAEFFAAHEARAKAVRELESMRADYTASLSAAVRQTTLATVEATARKQGPPLSKVIEQFVKENQTKGSWTPKTKAKYEAVYRMLIEGLGNPAVNEVSRDDMVDWLARLVRQPKNAKSIPKLKDLSFLELAELEGYPTLSATSINDMMGRASGVFAFAMKVPDCHMQRNPAESLTVPNKTRMKRRPFGLDQLKALFGHESWRDRQFLVPYQYWLPLLGLLSGMRINEICQLKLKDFIKVDGIECIKCADLSEGSRGKNENATRTFPVHKELIRLGLLEYVEFLRKLEHAMLFPELNEGRDGYGSAPSKWFGRYCESVGVTESCYVFHSFRHLFISQRLNQLKLPKHTIQLIVGHEQEDVTTAVYFEGAYTALQEVVDAAGFPSEILPMIPACSEITFAKVRRLPPSRKGARKSREKRIADAATRKAKAAQAA